MLLANKVGVRFVVDNGAIISPIYDCAVLAVASSENYSDAAAQSR